MVQRWALRACGRLTTQSRISSTLTSRSEMNRSRRVGKIMSQRAFVSAFVCLAAVAQIATAAQMSPRAPVTVQGSTTPTLQQILDGLVVSGPAINANAPSNVQLWDNTSGPVSAQVVADF